MGPLAILSWIFMAGPLGVVLVLLASYSVLHNRPFISILCLLLFFIPLILTLIWGATALVVGKREGWIAPRLPPQGQDWFSIRSGRRVIHDAYFC
jgi:hypothetical protein